MTPKIIRAAEDVGGFDLISELGIQNDRPLVFLMSGAKSLQNEEKIIHQIKQGLVSAITSLGAVTIDGATSAGAMKILNDSLGAAKYSGPYVGFVPEKKAELEKGFENSNLGQHHSHFVFVEGENYGIETLPMFSLIQAVHTRNPVMGVIVGGGAGARKEVVEAVNQNLDIIVFQGSGRLADDISNSVNNQRETSDVQLQSLAGMGKFTLYDIQQNPQGLSQIIIQKLKP